MRCFLKGGVSILKPFSLGGRGTQKTKLSLSSVHKYVIHFSQRNFLFQKIFHARFIVCFFCYFFHCVCFCFY